MEQLKVKFLMGPAECNDKYIPTYSKLFLEDLSKVMGKEVVTAEMDEVKNQPLPVYFIASGGAEPGFKACYKETKEPYILLTTPAYNSLAAAMEIMGFLKENNLKGKIIFGTNEEMANELNKLLAIAKAKETLRNARLGCFGTPGGLIASEANFEGLKEKVGTEMVLFTLDELVDEYNKGGYEENEYTKALKAKNYNKEEVEKALNVYGALKRLIAKYNLTGVTVKCFDLLSLIHTTGCLALAILNSEGIPAACEGDQKSLLSMAVMKAITGQSGFMANPCSIDTENNEMVFAHCTLPLDMCDDYYLTTHFESGIGVAVSADIAPQKMTIFKCDGEMGDHYAGRATLKETTHKGNLCRTQMTIKLDDGYSYFSNGPISNHHIICKGDYKDLIDEFFKQL